LRFACKVVPEHHAARIVAVHLHDERGQRDRHGTPRRVILPSREFLADGEPCVKILVADKFEKAGIEGLKATGAEVAYEPEAGASLATAVAKAVPEVLIVRSTKVPAAAMDAAPGLKGIVRAGAGVDNIDVGSATSRGIKVCNCPGMNAVAVAELAMGLLLACDRRIVEQTAEARAGNWNKKDFSKTGLGGARGLKGSTLGVVGAGAIGRAVVRRALAFDMRVLAWSRGISPEHTRDLGAEWAGEDTPALLDLAGKCDAITIHLPLAPDTKGLIGKSFFDRMKPGAYIINTSRGGVIDEAALREAIKSKGLRAGLDVFEDQPATAQAPWASETARTPGVVCTHHTGASTDQAQMAVAEETVRIVRVFRETGRFENCVNG